MDETYTTQAIILKREPYRERDSRVIIYTPDKGKLESVVRGTRSIRSKLAGYVEPISLINVMVIRGRRCDYIGSASDKKSYANIKNSLSKVYWAGAAAVFLNRMIKPDDTTDAAAIFNLLKDFFDILDDDLAGEKDFEFFYNLYLLTLLAGIGLKPELYNCVNCHTKVIPSENYFSPARGGIVCKKCRAKDYGKSLTISDNSIKILRLVLKSSLKDLVKLKTDEKLKKELIKIIGSFKNYHSET